MVLRLGVESTTTTTKRKEEQKKTEKKNNKIYSKGGRVLNILGKGSDLSIARDEAYKLINDITWKDMYYRRDIGLIENE